MDRIFENLKNVREKMSQAALRSGRDPSAIRLVAVTKTLPAETVRQGLAAGIKTIGENRVQEAAEKYQAIGNAAEWHLIGHLQSNKAKKAVEIFSLIHSIDSESIAREVGHRATEAGKVQNILLEVNTSGESQKYGISPEEENVLKVVNEVKDLKGIKLLGLMTVGPLTDDLQPVRQAFRTLKDLFDRLGAARIPGVEMKHLSMGMSGDFETAIEEGSNMVRIGSAIFGPRAH